ncbi:hypothetical protein FNO01nite_31750 [Flavobacterium noncentrifugens]|uniref:Uncharacterized protein n=1 Tax=Flavobacterium noncentrifugens TaxID=1128970 RepID=A0A1G9D3Y8_9FLAO|nr:hypothetical protein FNO01nite_31750 [Flavobacterium noncentrifugens]SDK58553.1 hypothetical protein SAMN04487935_3711 [Flavobacterium noncentrifugens]
MYVMKKPERLLWLFYEMPVEAGLKRDKIRSLTWLDTLFTYPTTLHDVVRYVIYVVSYVMYRGKTRYMTWLGTLET